MLCDLCTRIHAYNSRLVLCKQDGGAALSALVHKQGKLASGLGYMSRLRSRARCLAKRRGANLGSESCLHYLGAAAFSNNEVVLTWLLRHIRRGGSLVRLAMASDTSPDSEDSVWIGDRVVDIQTKENSLVTALKIPDMVVVGPVGWTGTGMSTQTRTVVSILAVVALCDSRGEAK